ncbi:MAG: hypothetical protein EBT99_13990 [Betaproteobacteria bacterium]|nr:hypothetical protein [Betaproteobacteria bacterium]
MPHVLFVERCFDQVKTVGHLRTWVIHHGVAVWRSLQAGLRVDGFQAAVDGGAADGAPGAQHTLNGFGRDFRS